MLFVCTNHLWKGTEETNNCTPVRGQDGEETGAGGGLLSHLSAPVYTLISDNSCVTNTEVVFKALYTWKFKKYF